MEDKHCPFMNVRDVIFECYQERCALWINGRCAIVAIAETLSKPVPQNLKNPEPDHHPKGGLWIV